MKKYMVLLLTICSTPLFSANQHSIVRTLPKISDCPEDEFVIHWPQNDPWLFTFETIPLLTFFADSQSSSDDSLSSSEYSQSSSDEDYWDAEADDELSSSDFDAEDGMLTELPDVEYDPYRLPPAASRPRNIAHTLPRRPRLTEQANQPVFPTRFTLPRQYIPRRLAIIARAGVQTRRQTLRQRIGLFNREMSILRAHRQNPSPLQIRMREALQRELLRWHNRDERDLEVYNIGDYVHNPDGTVYIRYESDDE